ncbi:LysR family transcriptional regulator [Emcibacter nanhaiensis]|uniref:LysR family transcriptional regulator n=1 Tax=Emcibacter nanhaiensis TaxID=1505037 RepID=A0A501P9X7_9PROT|nr:LysR family transcriptional regulator [Emcibacter nanhaiensis]TPD56862.1 LysR family transcriptional regulator [Emcibacter nanhaiensis]
MRIQDIDLKLLRIFQSVARHRGFSAAQEELGATQSAISMNMVKLEERLGMRLCERGVKGFRLTNYGKEVLALTEKLFASMDDFRIETSRLKGQIAGSLRIGIVDNISFDKNFKLPQAIRKLNELYPDLTVDIMVGASHELEERIMDGRIRAAIGTDEKKIPQFVYRNIFVEYFELYCSQHHPLFDIDDADITDQMLLSAEYASFSTYPPLDLSIGLSPAISSPYIEALANLALSGKYIAYLPSSYAENWGRNRKLRSIRPSDLRIGADIRLTYRRSAKLAPELEAFIKILINQSELSD